MLTRTPLPAGAVTDDRARCDRRVLRWTGGFGLAGAVLLLIVVPPLYFAMGPPPSLADEAVLAYLTNIAGIAYTVWLATVALAMMRAKQPASAADAAGRTTRRVPQP